MSEIDLSICDTGDILISSKGSILQYVCKTPWGVYKYLDHVVKYICTKEGYSFAEISGEPSYGTRTNDGFVYRNNRDPKVDNDIVKIIKIK